MKINHLIKIFFAAIILLLQSCSSGKNNDENTQEGTIKKEFLTNIKTVKPTLSNQEQELILSGKVECDPNKVAYYTPLISGVITQTYFSLGDKVSKGQTMLNIRSAELSSLQSELAIARRNVQSAESMHEDKLISERELIEARSTYKKLQADLSLYGENKGGGVFAIKSPMTGFVVDKNASAGSTVSEGDTPLFTIADLSTVWIIANVYAGDLQSVKEGMSVEITTLAYPNEVFSGKIDALSQVFDSEEKVLKARIVMPNKDLKFKPEMSVVVKLRVETQCIASLQCLSISSDALIFDDNKYFVVVETTPGNFEIREVQLQGHHQKTSYIRSGLNEDDEVVVKNQLLIYSELKGK
ncbi:MAG: efflux RND transporter periplasmic adaptor subunit [Bacteroidetes bacterium]|nr:efflux RND transporter periplasmic adaptor subunit [Bacteroidota bacterium]